MRARATCPRWHRGGATIGRRRYDRDRSPGWCRRPASARTGGRVPHGVPRERVDRRLLGTHVIRRGRPQACESRRSADLGHRDRGGPRAPWRDRTCLTEDPAGRIAGERGELDPVDAADGALRRVRGYPRHRFREDDEIAAPETAGADPDARQRRPGVPDERRSPPEHCGGVRGAGDRSPGATSETSIATGRLCASSSDNWRAVATASRRCESSIS